MKQNRRAKITAEDIKVIRSLHVLGRSDAWLAVKYDVSVSTIQRARTGRARKRKLHGNEKAPPEMSEGL